MQQSSKRRLKPREVKRLRRQEIWEHQQRKPLFPEPPAEQWKPLG